MPIDQVLSLAKLHEVSEPETQESAKYDPKRDLVYRHDPSGFAHIRRGHRRLTKPGDVKPLSDGMGIAIV